ncbi:MAG TPA: lysine--tRNA ligase [Candidatus Portnoybacteria bacterium]|nr:lysine--tRNA ligase [Candidatus Portnoybacteria bacterium]
MSLEKIKSDRLEKLARLKAAGIDAYPAQTAPGRILSEQALAKFEEYERLKKEIILAGRLRILRLHGGSCFARLQDGSGQIQLFFKKDVLGEEAYKLFADNFDVGDFVEVAGELFKTQTEEKTLLVKSIRLLTKSLNQLPDKWHGLKDTEERFRRRYLDLIMDEEARAKFKARSEVIKNIRTFLDGRGFVEVETPVLQALPGGALARPFKTHLNALDLDLYLRVAPELYLKRLLVGGFEKVYEMGRCFRNEGMDKFHNPDFTILEFYWAYADYEQLMELTEEMFEFLVPETEIEYQGQKINFASPFKRIAMAELIKEHYSLDINKADKKDLMKALESAGEKTDKEMPECKMVDELFKTIRPKIIQPTFITQHPLAMSPLAKASSENPQEAARFQLVVAGVELINAYSELNDSQEQAARMKMQENHREGDEEIQRFDQDFIEALEYGMPPAAGWGIGIDRLVMILTNAPTMREVILFPAMRDKE